MIEQAMFYALGFVSAGLLALACLPAVWKRAVRLTHRRLRQLVPLSAEEIAAERDQLRAGFAVDQRRLEQKLDRSEATRATLLGEAGRAQARQLALEGELRRALDRAEGLAGDLRTAERAIHGFEAEAGTAAIALNDLTGLAERRFWEVETAQSWARALESGIDEGRATVAALQTRILGLETRLGDVNQALGVTKAELARTVQAVARAQAERDAARKSAERPTTDGGAAVAAEDTRHLAAERDALTAELATSRDLHAAALGTIDGLRRDLAAATPLPAEGRRTDHADGGRNRARARPAPAAVGRDFAREPQRRAGAPIGDGKPISTCDPSISWGVLSLSSFEAQMGYQPTAANPGVRTRLKPRLPHRSC